MKRTPGKPNTDTSGFLGSPFKEDTPSPPASDISVVRLIDDGLLALYREMKNLLSRSAKGKLDASDARDLRDHMKLLFELKAQEGESLRGITDEDLKAQAKATINDDPA